MNKRTAVIQRAADFRKLNLLSRNQPEHIQKELRDAFNRKWSLDTKNLVMEA